MKISNPRTSVGNQALATTWYVDYKSAILSSYVQEVSGNIIEYVDEQSGTAYSKATEQDTSIMRTIAKYLSGKNLPPIDGFAETLITDYITGNDVALHTNGYAWLNNGKIDPTLMPDLSVIRTIPITEMQIFNDFQTDLADAGSSLSIALAALTSDSEKAQYMVQVYLEKHKNDASFEPANNLIGFVQLGDMIVVSYVDHPTIDFTDYPYFEQRYIAGAWITTQSNDSGNLALVTKISFNQGEIININNKTANGNGAVTLALAEIYEHVDNVDSESAKIGNTLAADICKVMALSNIVPSAAQALSTDGQRFAYRQKSGDLSTVYIPYATLQENYVTNVRIDVTNSNVAYVSGVIGVASGHTELSGTNTIIGLIGERTDTPVVNNTGTLFAQINHVQEQANNVAVNVDAMNVAMNSNIQYSAGVAKNEGTVRIRRKVVKFSDPTLKLGTSAADETNIAVRDELQAIMTEFCYNPALVIAKYQVSGIMGKVIAVYEHDASIKNETTLGDKRADTQIFPEVIFKPTGVTAEDSNYTGNLAGESIITSIETNGALDTKIWEIYYMENISWTYTSLADATIDDQLNPQIYV